MSYKLDENIALRDYMKLHLDELSSMAHHS